MNRVGHALLWSGALALAALMAYTVGFDLLHSGPAGPGRADRDGVTVAVFYPDKVLWQEFRHGVRACAKKRLLTLTEDGEGAVVVATPRHNRRIRFDLHDVHGLRETKDEASRLMAADPRPVAVVGSSNTVLTEAIAGVLAAAAGAGGGKGPVLLVPWASAVLADRNEPGEGPQTLLGIHAGRTFRFCPNNQHQADLLVGCVAAYDKGAPPRRVVIVEDRRDPYSVDLAESLHRAVERAAPEAEIVERADSLSLPVLHDPTSEPGPGEDALAESIWRDAERPPSGRTTWVLLPLQEVPVLRMIVALRRHARRSPHRGDGPLRVVCGDGIGFSALAPLAGRVPFPVWCSSSTSAPAAALAVGQGVSPDTQIPAEIVSAVVTCLDLPAGRAATADGLCDALAALKLPARDPAAVGRSLAFRRSGERAGEDLGHVLTIRPDRPSVFAVARGPSGEWGAPEPLEPVPVVLRP